MAIKDLFSKQKQQTTAFRGAHKESLDEFRSSVESTNEIKEIRRQDALVVPDLHYASASNFSKFGSAKKYYADTIKRIYSQYPYDGSTAEKLKFKNDLTQLERYVLDNQYPTSTGFAVISPDGWGTQTATQGNYGLSDNPEYIQFYSHAKNALYATASNHRGNLHLNWATGSTIEFWMKKNDFPPLVGVGGTTSEAIFQVSGNVENEFKLFIYRAGGNNNEFVLDFYKSTNIQFQFVIPISTLTTFADSTWHHYAFSLQETTTNNMKLKAYVDGEFDSEQDYTMGGNQGVALSGSLIGTIGALGTVADGVGGIVAGYGKLSGSLDEFRIWRTARDGQQIGRNYFTTIGGGVNTDLVKYDDDHPVDLGVYFKFNAGITGRTSTDSTVLDYGGGLSNGSWTGYSTNSRNIGSAITLAGVGTEKGDPIIYAFHPDVESLSTALEASGTVHDASNMGNLQNSIPLWMLDEDGATGGELTNLLQIMGSYLDTLYMQIAEMSKYHNADYHDNNEVPSNPYNNRLLTSLGFSVPEFFIDKTVLETIANQDDKRKFEDKLNEIKNLIYKNIYNNLTYINKSKGTVKSIRNLLRCYGVDDDLFNFNVYADNAEFFLEDDYKNSSIKFDSLDLTPFSSSQNTEGVIYNFKQSGNDNSSPYISASLNTDVGFTVETNVIFPKTPSTYLDTVNLTDPAVVTASVFGTRAAVTKIDTGVPTPTDFSEMTVYVVKQDNTAKFQLTSSLPIAGAGTTALFLESDRFYDVYDNSRWNLSIRIKPTENPFNSEVTASATYTVEFSGYNYIQDIQQNTFSLSASLGNSTGDTYLGNNKRVYAGAERTNITGTLQTRSNMKLLSVLAWADYLESVELAAHARDITSYGRAKPYKNSFVFQGSDVSKMYLPKIDDLAMYWAFNEVTSSDSAGELVVPDLSSGSAGLVGKYGGYSIVTDIQNTAQGSGFPASFDVKDIQYLNVSTQQIPENLNTEDMIQILDSDDDLFFLDNRPVRYFFSMEASMYDTISREMLKTFAGIADYASMVGSPIVEHQTENKQLRIAREVFFSKVENDPDLEKYVSLYKFLDSAIESVLLQLMPASAEVSDRVRTIIENHIFERPHRRRHLIPNAKNVVKAGPPTDLEDPDDLPAKPPPCCNSTDINCQTANPALPICKGGSYVEEVEKVTVNTTTTSGITINKKDFKGGTIFNVSTLSSAGEKLHQYLNKYTNKSFDTANDSTGYNGWYNSIAERTEAGLEQPTVGENKTRNVVFYCKKNFKIAENSAAPHLDGFVLTPFSTTRTKPNQHGNIILPIIQREEAKNLLSLQQVSQSFVAEDLIKNFVNFDVTVTEVSDIPDIPQKQTTLPIQFRYSGSGGFFGGSSGSIIGHHRDVYYGDLETPLQGPFVEAHVGGYKNRHQPIGQTHDKRPELYKINAEDASVVQIYNPRIRDPEGSPTYHFDVPRVKFSREEFIKRAYNIRNIKTVTGSYLLRVQGNYNKNYQVVMTSGRRENNPAFVQQDGFTVTGSESTIVSGVIDFALPDRALSDGTYNKTVIVNRFSAPGEVATLSEGYLDVDAGEYSPYNALPYRNRNVVNNLNTFTKTPSAFGGYEFGSTVTASFHGTQRNRVYRIKFNSAGTLVTSSFYDNGFVSYGIPNKEFGYSWISASANPYIGSGERSSSLGLFGFVTSSTGITFYSGAVRNTPALTYNEVINFAGYLAPDQLITNNGMHYELTADSNLVLSPTFLTGTLNASASIYFLNLNGDYGFPSWKATRGDQHPVARYLRKNNYVLADVDDLSLRVQQPPVSTKYLPILHNIRSREIVGGDPLEKDLLLTYTFGNDYNFYGNYYDSINNKISNPFRKHFDVMYKGNSLLYGISQLYTGKNKAISLNSLVYREKIWPKEENVYRSITRDRTNFSFNWKNAREDRANQLTGSQVVSAVAKYSLWPMDSNTDRGELMNTQSNTPFATGPNYLNVRFGRYRLDGPDTLPYVNTTASSPRNTAQFGLTDAANQGPFDNTYAEWNKELRIMAKDYSILPEYRISDYIGDIVDSGFDVLNASYQTLTLTGSQATSDNSVFLERYVHSDSIPAIEILTETQEKGADRISLTANITKKFLPYAGFYPAERTLQLSTLFSQSLAPTTTVAGAAGSFQTVNNTIFSRLTYGSIRAGIATDTAIWKSGILRDVELTYASATFDITAPGGDAAAVTNLFTVGAATTENASIVLSSSYAGGISEYFRFETSYAPGDGSVALPFIINGDSAGSAPENAQFACDTITLSSSYFSASCNASTVTVYGTAAGVQGNRESIWLDVDHFGAGTALAPAYSGSVSNEYTNVGTSNLLFWQRVFVGADLTSVRYNPTASWSRLPFETIVSPSTYLNASSSLIENDPENFFASTASVNTVGSKYELASSNFYASVVDTFIQGGNLTTLKSAPETEWSFDGTYNNFVMDVVVVKDKNFTNHDDPAANGAPYTAHACFYQPLSASDFLGWDAHINYGSSSYGATIPPNTAWSENEAYVTINFDYNTFKNVVTDRGPTFADILNYSTKTFVNKQMFDQLGADTGSSTNSSDSQIMTVEAGVDLFNYDASNKVWQPTVRWECPIHNYTGITPYFPDGSVLSGGGDGLLAGDVNRGVWHQYSSDISNGLRIYIRGPSVLDNRLSGSLAQACGFEIKQKPIGMLAESAILKEYLIAIPFVTNDCDEEVFFHYDINEFERAYSRIGKEREGSLTEMLAKLRDLILPIKFNFIDKRDSAGKRLERDDYLPILPPFAMYVFEASQEIDQSNLSKMWQNILIDAGKKTTFEKFNISHEIKTGEIITPKTLQNDLFDGKLPAQMRFKIFKAKYRSNLLYTQLKDRVKEEVPFQKSVLGYNYPHDFYSLIETAKIDLGLEYYSKEEDALDSPTMSAIAQEAVVKAAKVILNKEGEE